MILTWPFGLLKKILNFEKNEFYLFSDAFRWTSLTFNEIIFSSMFSIKIKVFVIQTQVDLRKELKISFDQPSWRWPLGPGRPLELNTSIFT